MDLSTLLAIIVITLSVLFIGFLLGRYIYKRAHHLPTGDCAYCHKSTKKLIKEYRKCCNK